MKNQQKNIKKALVMGESKLCIHCVSQLIEAGWQVFMVISEDDEITRWARKNHIHALPFSKLTSITEEQFYLFSIINPHLIPLSFLRERKVILALNYHDSALPKYAGLNSTTWAILNNEKKHGVTLHKIVNGIDEGEIAAKIEFPISDNETAFSLNLKCSERFLQLFSTIRSQIEENTLTFVEQDLKQKTYYSSRHVPPNYGVINSINDLEKISRLARSLNFGKGQLNRVASLKLFI